MVSFQCEACSDVVKKPKLDQHRSRCHAAFSCLDCSKVFPTPADYKPHTTCVSEAEKYEKSIYKGPRSNDNLQNGWGRGQSFPTMGGGGRGRGGGWGAPPRYLGTGSNDTPLGGTPRGFGSPTSPVSTPEPSTPHIAPHPVVQPATKPAPPVVAASSSSVKDAVPANDEEAAAKAKAKKEKKEKKRLEKEAQKAAEQANISVDEAPTERKKSKKKDRNAAELAAFDIPSDLPKVELRKLLKAKRSEMHEENLRKKQQMAEVPPTNTEPSEETSATKKSKKSKRKAEEADLDDQNETSAVTEESGEKSKKKKRKSKSEDVDDAAQETVEVDADGEAEKSKKKKKRKSKHETEGIEV